MPSYVGLIPFLPIVGLLLTLSVTWRRLEHLVASWHSDDSLEAPGPTFDAATRRAGVARLQAAFRSPPDPVLQSEEDWLPSSRSVVS